MAQTVYQSKVAVTQANKVAACEAAAVLTLHLPKFSANFISLVRDANNFLVLTMTGPIPNDQVDHLGLTGPV